LCADGEAGDELGSQIIAGRLARDLMRLCFIMERRYAPYSKWLGGAFSRLSCAAELSPVLEATLGSKSWNERERHLCAAYEAVARIHNALEIGQPLEATVRQFHERPYQVLDAERFAKSVSDLITDSELRSIRDDVGPIGAIDQFADNTNLLCRADLCQRLRSLLKQ
jgi:hypothetical protein